MTEPLSVDLDALHSAIKSAISTQFPDLRTVSFYYGERETLTAPCCLMEITDFEPTGEDPGTGQLEVTARFDAYLILGFRAQDVRLKIRKLATSFAAFVSKQRWGMPVDPAEVTAITPDAFNPQFDKYEVWRVEWQQVLFLGENYWSGEGILPTEVLASWEPQTGPGNEDKYEPLEEAAQP
ncbi:hypothetical protein [Terasakiella sp.]|uniref:hypothetical protein n=1 Tax=Terasakiella sp. TaxID=2034861 RepID=UPI003AA95A89